MGLKKVSILAPCIVAIIFGIALFIHAKISESDAVKRLELAGLKVTQYGPDWMPNLFGNLFSATEITLEDNTVPLPHEYGLTEIVDDLRQLKSLKYFVFISKHDKQQVRQENEETLNRDYPDMPLWAQNSGVGMIRKRIPYLKFRVRGM